MDDENSSIISDLTRTWFNDWTIVSVAHKLESIREFDKVLMLDSGRIVEFESPDKLLNDPSSQFKKLYNS